MAVDEEDDPSGDWGDAPPTTVDLLPDDLAELEREEPTPAKPPPASLVDYERGRRDGSREERDRVLKAVGDILRASHHVGQREVAQFLDVVRAKLRHPVPR